MLSPNPASGLGARERCAPGAPCSCPGWAGSVRSGRHGPSGSVSRGFDDSCGRPPRLVPGRPTCGVPTSIGQRSSGQRSERLPSRRSAHPGRRSARGTERTRRRHDARRQPAWHASGQPRPQKLEPHAVERGAAKSRRRGRTPWARRRARRTRSPSSPAASRPRRKKTDSSKAKKAFEYFKETKVEEKKFDTYRQEQEQLNYFWIVEKKRLEDKKGELKAGYLASS